MILIRVNENYFFFFFFFFLHECGTVVKKIGFVNRLK